jgi:hypothetical protein
MKKGYLMGLMLFALAILMSVKEVFATDDVWTTATGAVTTASGSATAILIVAVGIPLAFLAFSVVKKVINKSGS